MVRSGGIKEDRFTGIRVVNDYGKIEKSGDLDLSEVDTMFFVYRKHNKLFRDDAYENVIANLSTILIYAPWNKETVYALTARQYKQCVDRGIEMLNLMDEVEKAFNPKEFIKLVRKDIMDRNRTMMSLVPSEVLTKLLPRQFHTEIDAQSNRVSSSHRLYERIGYGENILQRYQRLMNGFINSEIGRLLTTISKQYYNAPSKEFTAKLITAVVDNPELSKYRGDAVVKN